jgi:hypothetical protein
VKTKKFWETSKKEEIHLLPGERIVGVEGNTDHDYNGYRGFWKNLRFVTAYK